MQLVMHRPNLIEIPELPDIAIRVANDEDAEGLARTLTAAFEDEWTVERVRNDLLEAADVRRTYVIEVDGEIAATASAQTVPGRWPGSGVLHWVGTNPRHAGNRFGLIVSLAVLHDHQAAGHKDAYLLTDDFRLPAVKTYLTLGFRPVIESPEQQEAWDRVLHELEDRSSTQRSFPTVWATTYEPLETFTLPLQISGKTVRVLDGRGREYAQLTERESLTIGGALGTHQFYIDDVKVAEIKVEAKTKIDDACGRFKDLLNMLHFTMLSEQGEEHSCLWNGKIYRYFICWLRDHVHVLKGMKYFEPDIKSAIELYRDSQREDGMIWDNVYRRGADPNYWQVRFEEGGFYRAFDDKTFEFKRIPVENDVEYLFVEGIYDTWKATGDDAFMFNCLDAAEKALEYSVTSEYRWSEKLGLLKRGYTIDTWDFQAEGDRTEGDIMRIRPGETRFGAMFGDTTGYIAACGQLAEMLDYVRRPIDAEKYRVRAEELADRLYEVSWRNTHFQHHVPEDPNVTRDLGVDETQQISLSNAYTLNRGWDPETCRAIIQSYQGILANLPQGSPGEWYTIYPPFERGFGGHSDKWQYMNGSVTPIVAGELAHGAFQNGYEAYGADILNRLIDLGHRHGNRFHCSYTGALAEHPERKFTPLDLSGHANVDIRGPGDDSVAGWPVQDGNDLRELPSGRQHFSGVEFLVPEGRLGGIGLGSHHRLADSIEVDVDQTAQSIYFFHTLSGNGGGGIAGTVRIVYEDGSEDRQYMVRGRDILGFWMPELPPSHGAKRLDIGWKGANLVLPYVGVSVCGIDVPQPEKKVRSIILERSAEELNWFVMGITLSDQPVHFPPSPVSFGIPNGWGAAAVVYALVEGLAGVVDEGTAFSDVRLEPRWSSAGVDEVAATITYPASGGYVAYRYHARDEALEMTVTGSGEQANVSVLLPSGSTASRVLIKGEEVGFEVRDVYGSTYVDFNLASLSPQNIHIIFEPVGPEPA